MIITFISESALYQRINRHFRRMGSQRLSKATRDDVGPYYISDLETKELVAWGIKDLPKLARELGLLKPNERVEGFDEAPPEKDGVIVVRRCGVILKAPRGANRGVAAGGEA